MAIELTYGGARLLFPEDASLDFIDEFLAIEEANAESSHYDRRTDAKTPESHGIGLPTLNYPPAPRPQINRLYWPTGAARWASGYFLADTAAIEQIERQFETQRKALELVAKNGDEGEFKAKLWMLQPRQVTAVKDSKRKLFILPLVDERYYWRSMKMTPVAAPAGTNWSELFTEIGSALGVSINAPSAIAPSDWLWPDHLEVTRRCEDPALLLDAAAWSVGGIVVRQPSGKVEIQQWADGAKRYDDNLSKDRVWSRIAGGKQADGTAAEKVTCVFRWMNMGAPCDEVFTLETTPEDIGAELPTGEGIEHVAHVAAYAEAKGSVGGIPFNAAALSLVASSVTKAYYDQRARAYDETFAGIKNWTFGAHDDAAIYSFGTPSPIDEGILSPQWTTRVRSHAQDFGPTEWLNQERLAFHGLRWGVTLTPALPPDPQTTGHNCWYVVANPCDDCEGANRNNGIQHEVVLPIRPGFGMGLAAGAVISYQASKPDCRWTIQSDYSTGPHKLKAILTDKLWPNQPLALFAPLTVTSIVNGQLVYAATGYKLKNAWNPKGHAANRTGLVYLEWDQSLNFGLGGYYVDGVQKRAKQVVIDVQDSQDCLGEAKLMTALEYTNDPGNYCTVALYGDCDDETPDPQQCVVGYVGPSQLGKLLDECYECCATEGNFPGWAMRITSGAFTGGVNGCCNAIQASLLAFGAGSFDQKGFPLTIKVDQCTWISPYWINGCEDAPFTVCFRLEPQTDVFGPDPTAVKITARLSMADGQLEWLNDDFNCDTPNGLDLSKNTTGCGGVPDIIEIRKWV